jgi:thiamine biosynthesis lipoprotein
MAAVLLVSEPAALPVARCLLDRELADMDSACSRFRADSELTRINETAGGRPRMVSGLLAEALDVALRAARLSDGAVDPTVGTALCALGYDRDFSAVGSTVGASADLLLSDPPEAIVPGWRSIVFDRTSRTVAISTGTRLDLGATAKALVADRTADKIARRCGCGALVGLGGDFAAAGPAPEGGWRILVTGDHRSSADAPGQTVSIASGGLATSGTAPRAWTHRGTSVHHIIDPASGRSAASGLRTVSVAACSCVDANTASTATIVRGTSGIGWLEGLGLPARVVGEDGTVTTVAGWPAAGATEAQGR